MQVYLYMCMWTHSWICGEYPGLLCPLVSRWSSVQLRSSCVVPCNRPFGLPLISPGGLAPIIPDMLFIKPGLPSNGKEVSANAAYERKREGIVILKPFQQSACHSAQLPARSRLSPLFYRVTSELLLKNQSDKNKWELPQSGRKKNNGKVCKVPKTISSPYKTGLKWITNKESPSIHMIMKPSKTLPKNSQKKKTPDIFASCTLKLYTVIKF